MLQIDFRSASYAIKFFFFFGFLYLVLHGSNYQVLSTFLVFGFIRFPNQYYELAYLLFSIYTRLVHISQLSNLCSKKYLEKKNV